MNSDTPIEVLPHNTPTEGFVGEPEGLVGKASRYNWVKSDTPGTPKREDKVYEPKGPTAGEGDFFNRAELPAHFAEKYKHEKPEHRVIAWYKAACLSNKEISELTGYTTQAISQICQLPWVREVIENKVVQDGKDRIQAALQGTALDQINHLIEIADPNSGAQTRDRITASKELLDRWLGKPNQPISVKESVDKNTLSDDELERIASVGGRRN